MVCAPLKNGIISAAVSAHIAGLHVKRPTCSRAGTMAEFRHVAHCKQQLRAGEAGQVHLGLVAL